MGGPAVGFWAGPNPAMVVFGLTTIVTSGAAIGLQLDAAVVFVVETLAVVELILLSNLVAPTRTDTFLRRLHDWTRSYRRQILVVMLAMVDWRWWRRAWASSDLLTTSVTPSSGIQWADDERRGQASAHLSPL